MKMLSIGFWANKTNKHFNSAAKGLTKDQVEALKDLKEGDRLVLFVNEREGETQPKFNLKVSINKADDTGGL
jgi:hypothetical protein